MKKSIISLFCLAAIGVTGSAMAYDGQINFTGSISDQTCTVDSAAQGLDVDLGKVAKSALQNTDGTDAAGVKSSAVKFALAVSSCPDTVTGATVTFDGTSASDTTLLAIESGATAAKGVGIGIYDSSDNLIPLHSASTNYPLSAGPNTLNFLARYVSTGEPVVIGAANGTAQFTFNYK